MLMDDSGDGELDSEELMFGLRDFGVLLTPDEVGDVVQQFDTDGSGAITVTDLHLALRGDMAPKRVALVNKAFGSINPYMAQQGEIPVREIMKKYSPYANPFLNKDALPNIDIGQRGAYSEDDVIRSFQSAIDDGDGSVSRAEFLDFYRDISACIESDDYFEEFIRESWGLPKDGKKRQSAPSGASSSSAAGAAAAVPHAAGESAGINPVVLKLKAQVRGRGPKGLVRLGRAFRAVDDDGNRLLDADQFAKVLKGEGFELSNNQLSKVFLHYDDDMSGYVDYVETVKLLAPAIPERRLGFILEAFDKLDKRGDLVLPLSTVTGAYSPADHPSVTLGRDTRDSVFAHLEESLGGAAGGGKVTLDDFERHYIMRSAVIGDDDYFELIMRQVWQLDGTPASAAKAEKEARKRAEPKKKVIKVKPAAERAPFDCGDGWVGNPFTVGHAKWNAETNEMDIVRPGRKAAKALTLPTMPLQSTMRDDALIDPYNPPRNPWVRLKQMLFPRGDVLVFPEMCERLAVSSGNPALMPRMSSKAFAIQAKRLELKNGRSLTPKNAKELTDVVDPNRTSFVELPWLYKQLGLRFGFPAKGEANGVFHRVRKMILENTGREGVKGLVATFKR
jgi:Ca2+-binding EF-hand superfamily protein